MCPSLGALMALENNGYKNRTLKRDESIYPFDRIQDISSPCQDDARGVRDRALSTRPVEFNPGFPIITNLRPNLSPEALMAATLDHRYEYQIDSILLFYDEKFFFFPEEAYEWLHNVGNGDYPRWVGMSPKSLFLRTDRKSGAPMVPLAHCTHFCDVGPTGRKVWTTLPDPERETTMLLRGAYVMWRMGSLWENNDALSRIVATWSDMLENEKTIKLIRKGVLPPENQGFLTPVVVRTRSTGNFLQTTPQDIATPPSETVVWAADTPTGKNHQSVAPISMYANMLVLDFSSDGHHCLTYSKFIEAVTGIVPLPRTTCWMNGGFGHAGETKAEAPRIFSDGPGLAGSENPFESMDSLGHFLAPRRMTEWLYVLLKRFQIDGIMAVTFDGHIEASRLIYKEKLLRKMAGGYIGGNIRLLMRPETGFAERSTNSRHQSVEDPEHPGKTRQGWFHVPGSDEGMSEYRPEEKDVIIFDPYMMDIDNDGAALDLHISDESDEGDPFGQQDAAPTIEQMEGRESYIRKTRDPAERYVI